MVMTLNALRTSLTNDRQELKNKWICEDTNSTEIKDLPDTVQSLVIANSSLTFGDETIWPADLITLTFFNTQINEINANWLANALALSTLTFESTSVPLDLSDSSVFAIEFKNYTDAVVIPELPPTLNELTFDNSNLSGLFEQLKTKHQPKVEHVHIVNVSNWNCDVAPFLAVEEESFFEAMNAEAIDFDVDIENSDEIYEQILKECLKCSLAATKSLCHYKAKCIDGELGAQCACSGYRQFDGEGKCVIPSIETEIWNDPDTELTTTVVQKLNVFLLIGSAISTLALVISTTILMRQIRSKIRIQQNQQ